MPVYEMLRCKAPEDCVSLESLAAAVGLHPALVEKYVAYGLVSPAKVESGLAWFDVSAIGRLRAIRRLRCDLYLNLPGIAVALELVERIEILQQELRACAAS